jgi:HdeA/HdeB family
MQPVFAQAFGFRLRQIGGKHAGAVFSEITCIARRPVCLGRQWSSTWMDAWYKGDSDEAIIDTDVFVENAKKFGTYCGKNPTMSIVNAAEAVLGK